MRIFSHLRAQILTHTHTLHTSRPLYTALSQHRCEIHLDNTAHTIANRRRRRQRRIAPSIASVPERQRGHRGRGGTDDVAGSATATLRWCDAPRGRARVSVFAYRATILREYRIRATCGIASLSLLLWILCVCVFESVSSADMHTKRPKYLYTHTDSHPVLIYGLSSDHPPAPSARRCVREKFVCSPRSADG